MTERLPTVFIGSSSEGVDLAREVEMQLQGKAITTIWKDGVFLPGTGTLEVLLAKLDEFDFAVFVLSADDLTESRNCVLASPRDNVVFELGLFMGKLGRSRTFVVYEKDAKLKLPSDVAGITLCPFVRREGNLSSALSPACTPIIKALKKQQIESESFQTFWESFLQTDTPKDDVHVVFSAKWGSEWVAGRPTARPGHTVLLSYNELNAFQKLQKKLAAFGRRFSVVHGGARHPETAEFFRPDFSLEGTLIIVGSPNANLICAQLLESECSQFPFTFGEGNQEGSVGHEAIKCVYVHQNEKGEWNVAPTRTHFSKETSSPNEMKASRAGVNVDICLVARVKNPFVGAGRNEKVLILCGCHGFGTESAIKFVGDSRCLSMLPSEAIQKDTEFAVLLEAHVADGSGLTPRLLEVSIRDGRTWPTRPLTAESI